jgi:hypothetical protein
MWWTDVKIGGEMDSVLVLSAVIHGLQLWWTDVKIGGEMDSVLVPSAVIHGLQLRSGHEAYEHAIHFTTDFHICPPQL